MKETNAKRLIGKKVKIWHEGGIYLTLNLSKNITWPSEEIRKKGGSMGWGKFWPHAGDTGTIVHVFPNKESHSTFIFLLQISNYYVPIACNYLTETNKPDSHLQSQQDWIRDSIANVNYALGCQFKLRNVNENWSRAGLTKMDKAAEIFACSLLSQNIDTVMLCKYIFDNGSSPNEKAFALWLDKGKGYMKAFFNNSKHRPTQNKVVRFDTKPLINYFFLNQLDTVTAELKDEIMMSHSMGYSIELQTPSLFFRERLTDSVIWQDKTHPKSKWWNMITENLATVKKD